MNLSKIWLWVTGRRAPWVKKKIENPDPSLLLQIHIDMPEYLWQVALTGDFFTFTICTKVAPFFLHRWAQRFCFGIKWRFYKK